MIHVDGIIWMTFALGLN